MKCQTGVSVKTKCQGLSVCLSWVRSSWSHKSEGNELRVVFHRSPGQRTSRFDSDLALLIWVLLLTAHTVIRTKSESYIWPKPRTCKKLQPCVSQFIEGQRDVRALTAPFDRVPPTMVPAINCPKSVNWFQLKWRRDLVVEKDSTCELGKKTTTVPSSLRYKVLYVDTRPGWSYIWI